MLNFNQHLINSPPPFSMNLGKSTNNSLWENNGLSFRPGAIVHFTRTFKFNHKLFSTKSDACETWAQHFYYILQSRYICGSISIQNNFIFINKMPQGFMYLKYKCNFFWLCKEIKLLFFEVVPTPELVVSLVGGSTKRPIFQKLYLTCRYPTKVRKIFDYVIILLLLFF